MNFELELQIILIHNYLLPNKPNCYKKTTVFSKYLPSLMLLLIINIKLIVH